MHILAPERLHLVSVVLRRNAVHLSHHHVVLILNSYFQRKTHVNFLHIKLQVKIRRIKVKTKKHTTEIQILLLEQHHQWDQANLPHMWQTSRAARQQFQYNVCACCKEPKPHISSSLSVFTWLLGEFVSQTWVDGVYFSYLLLFSHVSKDNSVHSETSTAAQSKRCH